MTEQILKPSTPSVHFPNGFGADWDVKRLPEGAKKSPPDLREFLVSDIRRFSLVNAVRKYGFVVMRGFRLVARDLLHWSDTSDSFDNIPWHTDRTVGITMLTQAHGALSRNVPTLVGPVDVVNTALTQEDLYKKQGREHLWRIIKAAMQNDPHSGGIMALGDIVDDRVALALAAEANSTIADEIYSHPWQLAGTILCIDNAQNGNIISQRPKRTVHARFLTHETAITGAPVMALGDFRGLVSQ